MTNIAKLRATPSTSHTVSGKGAKAKAMTLGSRFLVLDSTKNRFTFAILDLAALLRRFKDLGCKRLVLAREWHRRCVMRLPPRTSELRDADWMTLPS